VLYATSIASLRRYWPATRSYAVCTGLCFIHWFSDATREGKGEQSTLYASEGSSARMASVRTHARTHARTHVRTRARNPFKDENKSRRKDKQRGREREREREIPRSIFPRAHILFHSTRTLIWLAYAMTTREREAQRMGIGSLLLLLLLRIVS